VLASTYVTSNPSNQHTRSGKGLGATLLSYLLPNGHVVMIDANGEMALEHVLSRPNLSFRHLDIFSAGVPAVVQQETAGSSFCIALGMHLCGALSPRLIDLSVALDDIDAMVLCPCCLKGAHGKAVAAAAKARGVEPYSVLIETLAAICQREIALLAVDARGVRRVAAQVNITTDVAMLSPRNTFVTVTKTPLQRSQLSPGVGTIPVQDSEEGSTVVGVSGPVDVNIAGGSRMCQPCEV
jgi:hypothetical protein